MPRALRRLLVTLGILAGVVVVLQIALEIVVDPDFLAGRLDGALGEDSPLRAKVGGSDPGFLGGSLTVTDLSLVPADPGRGSQPPLTADVPRVVLRGIDRWTLVVHGGLRLDRLEIERPQIRFRGGGSSPATAGEPADSSRGRRSLADRVASLPPLAAGTIDIVDASLSLAGTGPAGEIAGIDLSAGDVEISAAAARADDRVLFSRWIAAEMAASRWRSDAAAYELGPLRISTGDSLLWLERFAVLPLDSTGTPAAPLALDADGTQIALGPLTIEGLAWRSGLTGRPPRVAARRATVGRVTLHVFSDKSIAAKPGAPPAMPHEKLHALAWLFTVDSLHVASADVRYSERPADGGEPGSILFASIQADVANVSNDPARGAPGHRATVELTAALADTAPLRVHLSQDLLAGEVAATVEGSLARLPASAFNSILTPLEGIRFQSGLLDTLAFRYRLAGREAVGDAEGRFRNLAVEIVGKDRHSGPVEDLKGLVGNLFVLRSESDGGAGIDSLQTVPIRYERLEGDTYLKFLWAGLRSGLKNLIGL